MNKFFSLIPLFLSVTVNVSAQSFAKLEPTITQSALDLRKKTINELNSDEQNLLCNYFFLTSSLTTDNEENIEQLTSCLRSIQENSKLVSFFEEYQLNATEIIQTYVNHLENKIATLKSSPEDSEAIFAKLEAKVYELFAYINTIYYNILHSYNSPEKQI